MKEVIVQDGQTLSDICIQVYGSLSGIKELAELNAFISVTPDIPAGSTIMYDPAFIVDNTVVKYFAKNRILCASRITEDEANELGIFDNTFDDSFN